jgi:O-antigen ligase
MSARPTPLLTAFGFGSERIGSGQEKARHWSQRIVVLLTFALPVAVCLYLGNIEPLATLGSVEFTQPDVIVILLFLVALIHSLKRGFHWLPKQIALPLGLFFSATLLSACFAQDKLRGFAAVIQMFEFVALIWAVSLVTSSKKCLAVIHFLLAVFIFESLVAIFQFVTGDPLPRGTFLVHQTYSMFMGAGAAVSFALFSSTASRTAKLAYFCIMLVLLFGALVGQERAPWLCFILSGLGIIYLAGKQRRKLFIGFVCAVIVAATLVLTIPDLRDQTMSRLAEAQNDSEQKNSLLSRLAIWGVALHLFQMHPILGVGPKNFIDYVPSFLSTQEMMGEDTIDPHNAWVGILAEGGLLGFVAYAYLIYTILRLGVRKVREPDFENVKPIVFAYLAYHFFWFGMSLQYFMKANGHLHFMMIGLLLGVQRGFDLKTSSQIREA